MILSPDTTMQELLEAYPGAQRAMFRHFHIGGCASCGFLPDEKLADVCARSEGVFPENVMEKVRESHAQDAKIFISAAETAQATKSGRARLLDIRTREEFEAVHLQGAELFSQEVLQKIMDSWPKDTILIIYDHTGSRCLDAAAYFIGHGFLNARALQGGIDAWSLEVDPAIVRYSVE